MAVRSIPGYEVRLVGDRGELVYGGACLLRGGDEGLGGVAIGDSQGQEVHGRRRPQHHGEQPDI